MSQKFKFLKIVKNLKEVKKILPGAIRGIPGLGPGGGPI